MHAIHGHYAHTRFPLALAASAGLHILLSTSLGDPAERGVARPFPTPLTVRLELALPPAPADSERAVASVPPEKFRLAGRSNDRSAESRPKAATEPYRMTAAAALPVRQDNPVYAVHELDVLPTPARAIEAAPPGTAGYRIELIVDERGVVESLALLAPRARDGLERALQELEATRFNPARKDGRAVRSRIVLQVSGGGGESAP